MYDSLTLMPPSKGIAMDTQILSLESHDFVELEEALNSWDHQYQQISPGTFYGRFLHTQNDVLGVYRKIGRASCRERV